MYTLPPTRLRQSILPGSVVVTLVDGTSTPGSGRLRRGRFVLATSPGSIFESNKSPDSRFILSFWVIVPLTTISTFVVPTGVERVVWFLSWGPFSPERVVIDGPKVTESFVGTTGGQDGSCGTEFRVLLCFGSNVLPPTVSKPMMVPRIPERLPVDVPEVTSSSCLIPEVHTRDGSGKGSGTVHVVSVPNGTDGPG